MTMITFNIVPMQKFHINFIQNFEHFYERTPFVKVFKVFAKYYYVDITDVELNQLMFHEFLQVFEI